MGKNFSRLLSASIAMLLLVAVFAVPVFAAECSVLDGKLVFSDTDGTISAEGTTVTATSYAEKNSSHTNTITLTNNSGGLAAISFGWSAKNANSCSIDGNTNASGTFSKNFAAGESVRLTITAKGSVFGSKTATLTLSNISCQPLASSYAVTVNHTSGGTVSIDGNTITSGTSLDVSPLTGGTFVASANSGYTFLGWVNTVNNGLLSTGNSYAITPTADMNIQAVFVNTASDTAWFNVDGKYLTSDLNKASELGTKIVLANNGTLAAGNYTVAAGDTLLIPFDANNTVYTTEPKIDNGTYVTPSAYRTLTMEEGANVTVNGALCLPAKLSTASRCNGAPTGSISMIKMQSESSIALGNGGQLYAWGFITGSGSITAESGSTVYEAFQITDWRGGPTSMGMEEVFIFSQYYIRNVEVSLTINSGAREYGVLPVTVDVPIMGKIDARVPFPMLGPSGAMFNISEGSVTKRYDGASDRDIYTVDGTMELSGVSVSVIKAVYSINTAEFVFPIPGHFTLEAINDSKLVQTQDLVLQPGCQVFIGEDATYTQTNTESDLFVLDRDEWIDKGYVGGGRDLGPCVYCPGRPNGDQTKTLTADDLVDTLIQVDGTMNIVGSFFTSAGGANICSTGTGVIKMTNAPAFGTNKQYTSDYVEIPVTACKLKNAGESYTLTEKSADENSVITNTYTYNGTKWICGTHTEVIDEAVAPTCTATGLTAGKHCSACNEVMAAQEEVAAKGHTPGEAATCETAQTCTVCNAVITPALGHKDENHDHACDNGCGVYQGTHADSTNDTDHVCDYGCGVVLEECVDGDDKDHNCDVCGKADVSEHSWSNATCTAPKTCSVCGATEGEKLGHTYGDPSMVWEGTKLTVTLTCGVCAEGTEDRVLSGSAKGTEESSTTGDCKTHSTTTYTATVTLNGQAYSDKTTITGEFGDHNYGDLIEARPAVHTKEELKPGVAAYYQCSVCKGYFDAEKKQTSIESLTGETPAHTPAEAVIENKKDATCGEAGSYDSVVYCSVEGCRKELSREKKTIDATGEHTGGEATCKTKAVCTVCQQPYGEIDSGNHKNTELRGKQEATEFEAGYTGDTYCTDCDTKIADGGVIPATHQHSFGEEWTSDATGHWHACTCEVKGDFAAHISGGAATEDSAEICTVCKYEIAPKLEHAHVLTKVEAAEATCVANGNIEHYKCSGCEKLFSDVNGEKAVTNIVIPATGHTYDEPEWDWSGNDMDGYTAATATFDCEKCDDVQKVDTTVSSATTDGKTVYTAEVIFEEEIYTDTKTVEIAEHKHSYVEEITKEATCVEAGERTFTCSGCGDSYTEVILATGEHADADKNCICDACGTVMLFDFKASNVNMGNDLDMKFAFSKNEMRDWSGCYAVINRAYSKNTDGIVAENDVQIVPFKDWSSSGSYYVVVYEGLAAKEMADVITVTVYNANGTAISNPYVDSLQVYCTRIIRKSSDDITRNLYVDMLNYGAAAQKNFDYGTDNLATSMLTEAELGYGSQAKNFFNTAMLGDKWLGSQISFESNIGFRIAFKGLTKDMYADVVYVNHDGKTISYTVRGEDFGKSGSVYFVEIKQLVVADARKSINVTVYNADTSIYTSCTESIESYLARVSGVSELYAAYMKFADSAYAYLHKDN